MRLILDTQIALWALTDSKRLGTAARKLILNPDNKIFVSSASVWEISIKHSLGRGDMPISGARAAELFAAAGYRELPVSWRHAAATEQLPPIHKDPFDRILIAQAMMEPMTLLTRDGILPGYGDMVQSV